MTDRRLSRLLLVPVTAIVAALGGSTNGVANQSPSTSEKPAGNNVDSLLNRPSALIAEVPSVVRPGMTKGSMALRFSRDENGMCKVDATHLPSGPKKFVSTAQVVNEKADGTIEELDRLPDSTDSAPQYSFGAKRNNYKLYALQVNESGILDERSTQVVNVSVTPTEPQGYATAIELGDNSPVSFSLNCLS